MREHKKAKIIISDIDFVSTEPNCTHIYNLRLGVCIYELRGRNRKRHLIQMDGQESRTNRKSDYALHHLTDLQSQASWRLYE